jgi:vanillate O-demethylase monooxygenase subunit
MYPFKEGSFAPRNGWYVAAFAQDVGRELVSRTILNQPVVLYRKEDGEAVAVGGRCPHRHFPLGKSCLKGDIIVCGYHGIAFGPDGACTDVPSQDHVPRSYRIPTYPLVEHGLWLWIWMGDADKADPALLPDLDDIGLTIADLYPAPLFTLEVPCRYQLLNDNLLDLTHLAFLHSSSIGSIENARATEEVTQEARVLRSRRYIRDSDPTPAMARRAKGKVDQIVGMDFHLPGLHAGIGDHYEATGHPDRWGKPLARSRPFHAITPSTFDTTYYFFAISTMEADHAERSRAFLKPVLDEDVFASAEIEKMIKLYGGNPPQELMLKSDHNAVLGRRMLQAMMDAEAAEAQRSPA